MRLCRRILGILLVFSFVGGAPGIALSAEGQILKKLKNRAADAAEAETHDQIDAMVRDTVRCAFNDFECIEEAEESGGDFVLTDADGQVLMDEDGKPVSDPAEARGMMGGGGPPDLSTIDTGGAPGLGEADGNYDFEPGDRVLFEDDYTHDNVGDFPRRMDFRSGNWDVVEWKGQRWLRNTGPRHSALSVPLPETLPETFTIEFQAYFPHGNQQLVVATATPQGRSYSSLSGNALKIGVVGGRTGVIAPGGDAFPESLVNSAEVGEGPVPIRIMVDGQYVKMYVGTRRVANVPNATFERSDAVYFENTYFADEEYPMLIGPIRVAAGGRDMYDVLAAEGRFTARGILFDVSSANIREGSAETLSEIGTMLQEHPELRLSIEGHTDSDGDDSYNKTLSENRAAAVREYLIEHFGVEGSRLESAGFGETAPVAPNDTAEGKQENRRVELVRL